MKKSILVVLGLMWATSVMANAVDDEANKKILKDAIVGAVTGAVAVEATKDMKDAPSAPTLTPSKTDGEPHKNFKHKHKDKKRPHGWDMGKKTGWGDSDVPPGLAKKGKKDHGED